jgi:hypothetical protein
MRSHWGSSQLTIWSRSTTRSAFSLCLPDSDRTRPRSNSMRSGRKPLRERQSDHDRDLRRHSIVTGLRLQRSFEAKPQPEIRRRSRQRRTTFQDDQQFLAKISSCTPEPLGIQVNSTFSISRPPLPTCIRRETFTSFAFRQSVSNADQPYGRRLRTRFCENSGQPWNDVVSAYES